MKSLTYFDDSLPKFAELVAVNWGRAALERNLFLRDASGRLTFVVVDEKYSADDRAKLAVKAEETLDSYVDAEGFAVATPEELFDSGLREPDSARPMDLHHSLFRGRVRLVDRRLVGADWMRSPAATASAPARLVFASLKGGVGRSTALCVLAAYLATRGRRVLAIDMDLEAPGLGNMLLTDDTLPDFGLLDYLVERGIGEVDEGFLVDMVGPSWLGSGRGRVDVVPAIGRRSLHCPANVLAKVARAYLGGGEARSFADHIRELVESFADPLRYDAILVDARAGLHETTAAAVVGLGAEVFFFGVDQSQTFAGYELLLAHLATLPNDISDDWRERLQFIQSKAPEDPGKRIAFAQRIEAMLQKFLWPNSAASEIEVDVSEFTDSFEVGWDDEIAETIASNMLQEPFAPIVAILDDDRFRLFDPINSRDSLAERSYLEPFRDFLEMATDIVESVAESEGSDT